MIFVDGPDGVGKTGYSKHIASEAGLPRLEMRPVESTDSIEEKSAVFNAAIRDLHDQGIDLVIDRGSVSSIVYSRIFDRGQPSHAWDTLKAVEPLIVYLRCDARELAVRYGNGDELFSAEEVAKFAETYDEVMLEVDESTGADVVTVDTTAGVLDSIEDVVLDYQTDGGSIQ